MSVELQNFTVKVKGALDDAVQQFLEEVGGEVASQAARNQTRVDTGATKGGWTHRTEKGRVTIGNPLENAIWEEFGTGDYAETGGRKGGWVYKDDSGKFHRTHGKKPIRPLRTALDSTRPKIEARAKTVIGGAMK